ncbi:serine hydrolase [Flavobacterium sp.]|uniref:serine hydrolase n=1 Tax=Flavobacterium sp. TaxID=239 RepID=UPI0028BDFCF4|nr:serine hydrolase [Flavobacterium sp.]
MNFRVIILISVLFISFSSSAQMATSEIDVLVEKTMKAFDVPGIAVAVVKDGKVIHSKGYGVRSIITKQKVDEHTLFGIASNSKSFTAAALGILADDGKLDWDDKVVKYIPEFKMYNSYVTDEFTIRDLLTHRSGLGLGAGDLMIWPDGHNFTPKDIINNIQYLKPVSGFRTKYDYDNLLYVIAGEVVERVSGKSWAEFVETQIMKPLEMNASVGTWSRLKDTTNTMVPHVPIDGKLKVITRYKSQIMDAAGGIYSNITDLSKWLICQMNKGKYGENQQLFSAKQHTEMWTPQTILPNRTSAPYNTLFKAYGLGWQLSDINGKLQVSHTGGLEGNVTQTLMIPELQLGIVVLTNQQSGAAFNAISNTIKDSYLNIPNQNWVEKYQKLTQNNVAEADKITTEVWTTVTKNQADKTLKTDTKKLIGTFKDNWLGEITIIEKKGKLFFTSKRSPKLSGEIFFYKDNTFVVKWFNRYFDADAFMFFTYDNLGYLTNIKMKPISPLTDFSYDFQDLDFYRVNP